MAFNGSGTFSLIAGNPVVTGTVISSTWANNTLTDIASNGLSNCLTKDGQTTPTANIPLGGFKITGLAAGTSATDAANISQIQNSKGTLLSTVAGTNTITAQATPTLTAYASGQEFSFVVANTNTGATTINIDSLGAKNIFARGVALGGNELFATALYKIVYDGTQFNLLGSLPITDTNPIAKGSSDATKQVRFEVDGLTTATTRVMTVPDKDITLAGIVDIVSVVGLIRNPKMSVTAASATATFTADEIILETALGGTPYRASSYSQAVNLGTTGAGGMDTGAAPATGFVSLYAIVKADGTKNILACNVTTSSANIYGGANMPTGYIASALIAIWPTNGSSQFVPGYITEPNGRKFNYQTFSSIFTATADKSTLTSQSISGAVPSAAKTASALLGTSTTSANFKCAAAGDGTGTGGKVAAATATSTTTSLIGGSAALAGQHVMLDIPLITAQTMYVATISGASTNAMYITDFTW